MFWSCFLNLAHIFSSLLVYFLFLYADMFVCLFEGVGWRVGVGVGGGGQEQSAVGKISGTFWGNLQHTVTACCKRQLDIAFHHRLLVCKSPFRDGIATVDITFSIVVGALDYSQFFNTKSDERVETEAIPCVYIASLMCPWQFKLGHSRVYRLHKFFLLPTWVLCFLELLNARGTLKLWTN